MSYGVFVAKRLYALELTPLHRPFYATLAFIAVALAGYLAYRFTLAAVNKRRQAKLARMTLEEIEDEKINPRRYGDKKYTFIYGL